VLDIAERLFQDLRFTTKWCLPTGLQINNRTTPNLFFIGESSWWYNCYSTYLAVAEQRHRCLRCCPCRGWENLRFIEWMLSSYAVSLWACREPQSSFYVAHDITHDQTMFMALIRSLSIATLLSILILIISIYIQRSFLQPVADKSVGWHHFSRRWVRCGYSERAPSEVKECPSLQYDIVSFIGSLGQQQQLVSDVSMNFEHPNVGPRLSARIFATKRQLDWTTAGSSRSCLFWERTFIVMGRFGH